VVALAACAGACQQYRAAPLELGAHREAFLARTPEAASVAEFARALDRDEQTTTPVFDPSDGVTVAEAEAIAMVFNTDLRVARARAGIAEATAAEAGLWEDPVIGVDLSRIIESATHPWKTFGSVGLTIPISGRLALEKSRAGEAHAAELVRLAALEWDTRMALRREWVRWEALEAQAAVAREFRARVDEVLGIVDLMERSGEISRTEARLFRIERATAALDLVAVESARTERVLAITRLMGLSPDAPATLVPTGLDAGRWGGNSGAAPGARGAFSVEANPRVAAAAAEYAVAERTLELEVRKQVPDVEIGPGFGREDGQDQLTLGIAIPIPILNANRRAIAEAEAARAAARAEAERAVEAAVADLALADVHLRAAHERRRTLESEIVPLVDAQYTDAREVARLGEVNTLVLLESMKRQHEAKVRLIGARSEESLAALQMEEIAGPEWARNAGDEP
jgi:outer membrane protein TolC